MSLPNWATLLKQYNSSLSENDDAMEYTERLQLATAKLLEPKAEKMLKTKNIIPPFFNPKQSESCSTAEIQIAVAEIARELFLDHQEEKLLSEHDLDCLFNSMAALIKQHRSTNKRDANGNDNDLFLNYELFTKLKELLPRRAHKFLTASIFRKFPLNPEGELRGESFHQFVSLSINLLHQFITLCRYDLTSNIVNTDCKLVQNHSNYLTESDLEIFVSDQIEMIPSLMQIDETLHPYYIYHAVRKFIFCLNPNNVNKQIPITKILCSNVFREFNEFRFGNDKNNNRGIRSKGNNWFSCANALRVYTMYLELDMDHNGTLSRRELIQFNQSSLSNLCIQRIFQYKKTWDQELDYKGFLNFVLAVEHKNLVSSLHYFWDILDLDGSGYLTPLTLHTLFRSVQKKMGIFGFDPIPAEDVVAEIIDMVHPKNEQKITKQDLLNSKMFGTVVDILTDVKGFWEYDNRESLVAADRES